MISRILRYGLMFVGVTTLLVGFQNFSSGGKKVQMDGELEVIHEDYMNSAQSRTRHYLRGSNGKRVELKFKGNAPHLLSGSKIRVSGEESGTMLALDSNDNGGIQVLAMMAPNSLGEQRTAVILVNFQDDVLQPMAPADVNSLVFGTINNYFKENSYQQTWLSGSVFGWYKLPINKTCNTVDIETYGRSAAASAGVDLSVYNRFVYIFPNNSVCSWAGLAFMGGNPSSAWINGYFNLSVIGHELGHNLGLNHAHGLNCDTVLDGTCSVSDYGDGSDLMGNRSAHFNAFEKEYLGWLNTVNTPGIITVESSGSYRLDPYVINNKNVKALKVLKGIDSASGIRSYYYLEYRQPLGFDSILSGVGNLTRGVQFRLADEIVTHNNGSFLLDLTPNSYTGSDVGDLRDGALDVGRNYTDSAAGLSFTVTSADATGATVEIVKTQVCSRAMPTMTISPAQGAGVSAGTAVSYSLSVKNNDDVSCGASSFNLQAAMPSGLSASFSSSSLSLSPGATGSASLSVTSLSSLAAGLYTFNVSAKNSANSSYGVSASASYSIVAALTASVSTDKAVYAKGSAVSITANVIRGDVAVSGASVKFTITKPNGAVVSATATTDASGKAVYKYRMGRKDPAGVYQVQINAGSGSQTATASTSFSVQ